MDNKAALTQNLTPQLNKNLVVRPDDISADEYSELNEWLIEIGLRSSLSASGDLGRPSRCTIRYSDGEVLSVADGLDDISAFWSASRDAFLNAVEHSAKRASLSNSK